MPFLHIADPTAQAVKQAGIGRIGLLGTRFTMEEDFYRGRLVERHGLDVIVPDPAERETVHRVIYDELCLGKVEERSRKAYRDIIAHLVERGAEGVILGCTEICLLLDPDTLPLPGFDSTAIHATAAVDFALSGGVKAAAAGCGWAVGVAVC